MESFSKNFSEALKKARGERSQAAFARFLGIDHQATYQRYESGRIPKGEVLHQIATCLGVTAEALLSGDLSQFREEPSSYKAGLELSEMTTDELKGVFFHRLKEYSDPETGIQRKRVLLGLIADLARELQKRIPL